MLSPNAFVLVHHGLQTTINYPCDQVLEVFKTRNYQNSGALHNVGCVLPCATSLNKLRLLSSEIPPLKWHFELSHQNSRFSKEPWKYLHH
jgi:hypothetical protein